MGNKEWKDRYKSNRGPGVVSQACNPSTSEVEAKIRNSRWAPTIWDQPELLQPAEQKEQKENNESDQECRTAGRGLPSML